MIKPMAHKVTATRTVFTFASLRMAAWHAFKEGRRTKSGSFYQWMSTGLFAALSLEAFLNHLGSRKLSCWSDVERSLSPETKLKLLLEVMDQSPSLSSRPFQTVKRLFRFRNQLAHGRTEPLTKESIQKLAFGDESPKYPETEWEACCTEAIAQLFLDDSRRICEQLYIWAGYPTTLMWSPSEGSMVSELVGESSRPPNNQMQLTRSAKARRRGPRS